MTQLVHTFAELDKKSAPTHLAIGMFDGIHLGHQAVIEAATYAADQDAGISGVLTFDPHPSRLFKPADPTLLLMPIHIKKRVLSRMGVGTLTCLRFTQELASINAHDFLPWLKQQLPSLKCLYFGGNFRFGKGREGDADLLIKLAENAGINAISIPRVRHDNNVVSSTSIRNFITRGDIQLANRYLGYHYISRGQVVSGKKIGQSIGFPTLNIPWEPELKPRYGVYSVIACDSQSSIAGVANYGVHPTVESSPTPLLEVHLLDKCPWTEGAELEVEWLDFIRPEEKFPSADALRAQIAKDCDAARERHGGI